MPIAAEPEAVHVERAAVAAPMSRATAFASALVR